MEINFTYIARRLIGKGVVVLEAAASESGTIGDVVLIGGGGDGGILR